MLPSGAGRPTDWRARVMLDHSLGNSWHCSNARARGRFLARRGSVPVLVGSQCAIVAFEYRADPLSIVRDKWRLLNDFSVGKYVRGLRRQVCTGRVTGAGRSSRGEMCGGFVLRCCLPSACSPAAAQAGRPMPKRSPMCLPRPTGTIPGLQPSGRDFEQRMRNWRELNLATGRASPVMQRFRRSGWRPSPAP